MYYSQSHKPERFLSTVFQSYLPSTPSAPFKVDEMQPLFIFSLHPYIELTYPLIKLRPFPSVSHRKFYKKMWSEGRSEVTAVTKISLLMSECLWSRLPAYAVCLISGLTLTWSQMGHFHVTIKCCWTHSTLWLCRPDTTQFLMDISGHRVSLHFTIKHSIFTRAQVTCQELFFSKGI